MLKTCIVHRNSQTKLKREHTESKSSLVEYAYRKHDRENGACTSAGNKSGCLENILSLKSLYLHKEVMLWLQNQQAKRICHQNVRLTANSSLERKKSYVPVTSLILSIALCLICEASRYLSSSERVLKSHGAAVEKPTERRPNTCTEGKLQQASSSTPHTILYRLTSTGANRAALAGQQCSYSTLTSSCNLPHWSNM